MASGLQSPSTRVAAVSEATDAGKSVLAPIVVTVGVKRGHSGFQKGIAHLCTHPSGRIWANSVGSYLCLFTLEGNASPTS